MDTLTNYKLTLLFIFAIVIPSTLLSLFSLLAISRERDLYRARIVQRYRQGADEVAAALDRRLAGPQQDLDRALEAAALDPLEGAASPLAPLVGEGRIFRAVAFVLPSGALASATATAVPRAALRAAELDEMFRAAEDLELRAGDDRAALVAWEEIARRHGDDEQVRAEALLAKARLYSRLEDPPLSAYGAYDELVRRFPLVRDRDGRILSIPARLEIAGICERVRDRAGEVEALEDAVRFIALHEEEIGAGAADLYRRRALERLQAISKELADRAIETAACARRDRDAARAFRASLERGKMLANLRAIQQQAAAGKEMPSSGWLVEKTAEGRAIVYWARLPRAGIAAVEVDVAGLRTRELDPVIAQETAHEDGFFALVERGAPVVAPDPKPDAEELARRPLRFPLDHLEVVALRRDPNAHDPLARLGDRVYVWAVGLALVGLAIGAFVMTRTVRKEMKAAALKSDFVTTVTHELKTPLTSIGMFAETLLMGRVSDKAEEKECLEIIAKETDRLTRLIDRVLTFSKIEARKKRFDLKLTDLAQLVEETLELFKTQMRGAAAKPLSVELLVVQDLPPVLMDRHSIQEVLLNLLSNAYKYGGEAKRIQVTLTKQRRWVLVKVRDWGIGIPWREQRKIFRKFYRANDVLTRDVEGSGIGLTLAKSIAQAHRGDITVKSKVGAGSTFTLWLRR